MTKTLYGAARLAGLAIVCLLAAAPSRAAQPKDPSGDLEAKAFFKPELSITSSHADLDSVLASLPNRAAWEGFLGSERLGFANPSEVRVWIDPRSGAATNILGAYPLIPGNGFGNNLTLDAMRLGALRASVVDARVVEAAVRAFVDAHVAIIGIDAAQLGEGRVTQVNEDLWQVYIPQL